MALTTTLTKIVENSKQSVIHYSIVLDGTTTPTAITIYDPSTDAYKPATYTQLRLEKLWSEGDAAIGVNIYWAGATPMNLWSVAQYDPGNVHDWSEFGGVPNKATTPTGILALTATGAGTSGQILYGIVTVRKS